MRNDDDYDQYDDEQDTPRTERMRKQGSKQTSQPAKPNDRRQRDKAWGRSMFKYHKERNRERGKP